MSDADSTPAHLDDAALLDQAAGRIDHALGRDRGPLRREASKLRQRVSKRLPIDRGLTRLNVRLEASLAERAKRASSVPSVSYPPELPVVAAKGEIKRAIDEHPVVVVCGETGSGKSTQLPKLCLELGRGIDGMIGHTQPRRIAARSLSSRIAEELDQPLGKSVGYQVRFEDRTADDTLVKLMTDGILLAETQRDRLLQKYDTLILDEAHERSLNIDFLLGYLKNLLPKRPDLKLIITSATIDPERFAEHFPVDGRPAPIVTVGGRGYPVETRYRPLSHSLVKQAESQAAGGDDDEAAAWLEDVTEDIDLPEGVRRAVSEVIDEGPGDALVFLPTERDILHHARSLRDAFGESIEVLPLYARLSPGEQKRVFEPHKKRRVVLSTNVAETSLTVPGIRYVIDSGLARVGRYVAKSGVFRLPIEPIAKASADQRRGRCGREGPGVCIRLYGEPDHLGRDEHTPPEIQRSNLADVILKMASLGLGDVKTFPFMDPPKHAAVRDGYDTLFELGALTRDRELTAIGETLAALPIDPRLGRMLIAAGEQRCLSRVLPIAASLAVGDVRLRPPEDPEGADRAHSRFIDEGSDFLTLVNLWDFVHGQRQKLSRRGFQHACRDRMLSHTRCREWLELHRQLREQCEQHRLRITSDERRSDYRLDPEAFHIAILSGFVMHVATKTDAVTYTGASGRKMRLWPGSVVFRKKPRWIVAAELVETEQLYARLVAPIKARWLEHVASHLLSRKYGAAEFDVKTGRTVIAEKATLRGLVVIPRRDVPYGKVDPVKARRMFIREALVRARHPQPPKFLQHNLEMLEEAAKLEAKTRTKGLVAGEDELFEFYDSRLPADIDSCGKLEGYLKRGGGHQPRRLEMSWSDVLTRDIDADNHGLPDVLQSEGMKLPLRYKFDPASADDGVTATAPVAALGRLTPRRAEWLVPGLLNEKVCELLRTLPKSERRRFVPLNQTADAIEPVLLKRFGQGALTRAVAEAIQEVTGKAVNPADFDPDALPASLRLNVEAIDDDETPIAQGRDVAAMRRSLGDRVAGSLQRIESSRFHRDGLTTWDFGPLPESVSVARGGASFRVHPALVDRGEAVGIRLFDDPDAAAASHGRGVRRLLMLQLASPVKSHLRRWSDRAEAERLAATWPGAGDLTRKLGEAAVARACLSGEVDPASIRDGLAFGRVMEAGWDRLGEAMATLGPLCRSIFEQRHAALLAMDKAAGGSPRAGAAVADAQRQLAMTLPGDFLAETPASWLAELPRHLRALAARFEKLTTGKADRDAEAMRAVTPHVQRLLSIWGEPFDLAELHRRPAAATYRWMVAEYRVSQFAQELGTALPVSAKRLEKQWREAAGG